MADVEAPLLPNVEVRVAKQTRLFYGIVTILLLGEIISNADASMMLASGARIMSEFNNLQNVDWLSTSYSLGVCAAQPLYGKLSDIYGRRAMMLAAYISYFFGCTISGFSLVYWHVIGGRIITGIGGAGLMTMASIIITVAELLFSYSDIVPVRDLAVWRSYINLCMTLGRSLGGPLGGWLTDAVGWRWLFHLQAALTATAVIPLALMLGSEHGRDDTADNKTSKAKLQGIDCNDSQLMTPISGVLLALALSCLVGFVLVERHVARDPVFPLSLLQQPNVLASYLVTHRATATEAGARLVPAVVGNAIGGLLAGTIIKRTGRFKFITSIACVFAASSYAMVWLFWDGTSRRWESLYIFPSGFGTGMLQAGAFVSMASCLEANQVAVATGGYFLFMNIGSTASLL
ncbi:major facilitator superfamily domain protein [Fusarium tjaetaba]|uniref:Major facilitator superfamily domain protein n=1 Tax=Fusarium tjaetaba TaxID=1567544 RepID=A0A8H5QZE8_9HYPO|nr:major facilitator superfamily domain protein [Fusarium tjaetaba]KAF5622581.1 major facilitator superfamily domain protein [Fusarium tjaetaba]